MKYFLLSILVFTGFVSKAQYFPSEVWHDGKLVTANEDTLRGKIKYDLENDLIQIVAGKNTFTYGARKMIYFEIFDKYFDNYRFFYSLPYETSKNYKVPVIFEVLYEGNLTLLCREYISQETSPTYYGNNQNLSIYKLSYRYFFVEKNRKINQYFLKKKELLDIMQKKIPEVKQFIKKNNLRLDRRGDLIRVTAYYNSLIDA